MTTTTNFHARFATLDRGEGASMSLDTQQFGLTRYWVSVALTQIPTYPDIFSSAQLSAARKAFLAGKNQLVAVKNWLSNAQVIELARAGATLTQLGKLLVAQDRRAEQAWTWWLIHLNLCAIDDSFPYSAFFRQFDSDGTSWMTIEQVIDALTKVANETSPIERASVKTYFSGIEQALRPGWPLHDLGFVERRTIESEGGERIRRRAAKPADCVIAYATLLFHQRFFPTQTTVETRVLLARGLARSLGIRDAELREALTRIHQDSVLSRFIQYRRTVNIDSVQFLEGSEVSVRRLSAHVYQHGGVRWP
jgi:hypothetical protein